jgi:GMP synthase (glutamine-hydrolyzing) (EC 6.3.5.2)
MVDASGFIDEAIAEIDATIGEDNAVIALSGGVDSSVSAALAYKAIGDQLTPVYVDTGLMRKGETEQVKNTFAYMDSLRVVDAQDRFFESLTGVTDPEEKRHVIGEQFIREFEREARAADADYLVQGTIYPDRIESEGNIKSHHNVGGLPDVIDFEGSLSQFVSCIKMKSGKSLVSLVSMNSFLSECHFLDQDLQFVLLTR